MNLKIIYLILIFLLLLIYINKELLKVTALNLLVVLRGILSPNCKWYNISDLLLTDGSGLNLYNKFKNKYGDFAPSHMYGIKIYIVTNTKYIKTIFLNSPNLFSVGLLKKKFFKSFMSKNVGVSKGCPWKRRRKINDLSLFTDKLHKYSPKYNNDIFQLILKFKNKTELKFENFRSMGQIMVNKIVFSSNNISNDIFKIFSNANSIEALYNNDFKINSKIYNNYSQILNHFIDNPNKNSLIELCMLYTKNKEEVFHQIPHFIFPIVGLFVTTIPRLLLLLCNHRYIFKKVIKDVYSINDKHPNKYKKIYQLNFLRKCILETLRLNNPVITTFRTLERDYKFDDKYSFKKGTQFLILNNAILREKDFFKQPNKFIPSRWTSKMEKSMYSVSFNQGPQRCPGKELAIYIAQSFIYNLIKIKKIDSKNKIICKKINTKNISQVINPCNIKFIFLN